MDGHYLYLGNELGGYRKGGYENHMGTPLYEQGLNIVESKAKGLVLSKERIWETRDEDKGEKD